MERTGKGPHPRAKVWVLVISLRRKWRNRRTKQLIEVITKGRKKMPPYGTSLKEPQIKELVAYIRDLAKK